MKAKHGRCIYIANSGDNYGFSRYKLSISDPDESDDEFYCEEEDMMSCNQFEKIFGFSIPQGYQIVIHLPSLIVEHIDNYWPFKEIKYNVKVVHVDVINGVPVTIKTEAKLDCEFISGNKYFGLHFTKDGLTVLDRQDMTMSDLIKINYYIKNCCDVFNDVKTRIKNINIEHIQRGTVINEDNARS